MTASNEQDSTIDFLAKLLQSGGDTTYVSDAQKFAQVEQRGPLRYWDNTMTCTSRRCGSPTHYKFRGMPTCTVHALRMMNEELYEYENVTTAQ